ncbi:hypothetical protein GCM10010357_30270 [Streptomyces luteireticuli]|uniref:Uncharacterized protein n=1 Tax=Streptomyces luteireticuli TaxID=173858 RepID=A0ABP3IM04_9ACTN
MPPAGQRVGELDEVLGAHQGRPAEQDPLGARRLEAGERPQGGHQPEADAVVEPVQRGGREPAGGDGTRHRQLGRQGRQDVAEEEDPGGAQSPDAPLQGAEDGGEGQPEERPEAAGHP